MTIIVKGLLGRLLITGGLGSSTFVPLLITQQLHSNLIATSLSPTPWSIDPERTQQLSDTTSPDVTTWSDSYSSKVITSSPTPTPWSIDPERTQEL